MTEPAIVKVEDALAAVLCAYAPIASQSIFTDRSSDIALAGEEYPAIRIYTTSYAVDVADENWQTIHTATIEVEAVSGTPTIGTISQENHATLAHVIAAVAADRTLGGMLHDIQEQDVAASHANGRDVGAASLQFEVKFFTKRDDWFAIYGQQSGIYY